KAKGRTEEEALKLANEIKAKIDGGASFEDMAKEKSDDAMTKARGGNMGLVSKDDRRLMMRGFQPVLEKAFELKVGEVAGPIKTQSGYEIITVTQGIELEPFESAKQSILFKVRNTTRDNLLAKLKKDSKIAFKDEEGKKAATKAEDAGKPPVIKIPPEKADQAEAAAEAPATPPPAEKEKAEAKTPAAEEAKKE
ncbi:MAG: peptidylprolyl isomerase, partial [Proteobacteria bacterium]|nr:peptidylprolyl isomerase [Pseudomonadota bacterium]